MRSADPLRVKDRQRPQQAAEARGRKDGRRRRGRARQKNPPRATPARSKPRRMQPSDRGGAQRRHEDQRDQSQDRSISTTVAARVFEFVWRAVSPIRTTSPPMLLGRKLLK